MSGVPEVDLIEHERQKFGVGGNLTIFWACCLDDELYEPEVPTDDTNYFPPLPPPMPFMPGMIPGVAPFPQLGNFTCYVRFS